MTISINTLFKDIHELHQQLKLCEPLELQTSNENVKLNLSNFKKNNLIAKISSKIYYDTTRLGLLLKESFELRDSEVYLSLISNLKQLVMICFSISKTAGILLHNEAKKTSIKIIEALEHLVSQTMATKNINNPSLFINIGLVWDACNLMNLISENNLQAFEKKTDHYFLLINDVINEINELDFEIKQDDLEKIEKSINKLEVEENILNETIPSYHKIKPTIVSTSLSLFKLSKFCLELVVKEKCLSNDDLDETSLFILELETLCDELGAALWEDSLDEIKHFALEFIKVNLKLIDKIKAEPMRIKLERKLNDNNKFFFNI